MLRNVKAETDLKNLERNISRIQRNQTSDRILELNRFKENKAEGFDTQVKNLLGETAVVRT